MTTKSTQSNSDLSSMAHSVGQRNRAGAPLAGQQDENGPQTPSYDLILAFRLLTAAHEVMQRVTDPSRDLATVMTAFANPAMPSNVTRLPTRRARGST